MSTLIYGKKVKPPRKPQTKAKTPTSAREKSGKRKENKARTKEKILQVALDLFSKQGLERTTTKQICAKAGIAEGTLFNYFKTKEDLALFFFQKETHELIDWFRNNARLQKAPLPEKLFAIIHRQLEYIAPYQSFIGSVFFRSLQPHSKLSPLSLESQELRIQYLRFIREILEEAEEKEELPPVGELGAYAVGLFYVGIVLHWLHDESQNKQKTLALLDRVLSLSGELLRKGAWKW